jgi:hypothetical protein
VHLVDVDLLGPGVNDLTLDFFAVELVFGVEDDHVRGAIVVFELDRDVGSLLITAAIETFFPGLVTPLGNDSHGTASGVVTEDKRRSPVADELHEYPRSVAIEQPLKH